MTTNLVGFDDALQATVCAHFPGVSAVRALCLLSAGASMETWAFDALGTSATVPLILRRRPAGSVNFHDYASLGTEAAVIQAAVAAGVAAPVVRYVLREADGLGAGFIMERLEGETIARKILRDPLYVAIDSRLLQQVAAAAAQIHAMPLAQVPALKTLTAEQTLDEWQQLLREQQQARPVFELALRYLRDHLPDGGIALQLVHGDYRLGNGAEFRGPGAPHPAAGRASLLHRRSQVPAQ